MLCTRDLSVCSVADDVIVFLYSPLMTARMQILRDEDGWNYYA